MRIFETLQDILMATAWVVIGMVFIGLGVVFLIGVFGPSDEQIAQQRKPQVVQEIDGIGFKTADKIAINIGFANDAAPRIDAGIIYALDTLQEDGHTAYGQNELRDHTANLLETSADLVDLRIKALIESKQIVLQAIPVVPDVLSLLKRN